jgi:hypothetical protein
MDIPLIRLKIIGTWTLFVLIGLGPDFSWSAENRNTLQIVAQIQPRASLSLDRTQISFAGPEEQALLPSREGPVQLTVKVRANAIKAATLNMLAESDLEGLGGSIPVQQVEWTASGSGTAHGVLSRTDSQMVGRYTTNGIHQTQLMFALKNNGNLPQGTYLTFVNFTFTSP